MRICIVVNIFPSVSETFIVNKVAGLAAKGNKVTVVCSDYKRSDNTFLQYNLASKNIVVKPITLKNNVANLIINFCRNPALFFKSFSFNIKKFKANYVDNYYVHFFNSIPYDIIHFEFSGVGIAYMHLFNQLKGKKIVSCRGTAEKLKPLTDEKRKMALQKLFQQVHAIHCVSADMQQTILNYGAKANKIFINRPAIDVGFFSASKLHIAKPVYKIVSVGRLTFAKGYVTALQVIQQVAKHFNIEYYIIGDGPQYEELVFHVQQLQIQQQVFLLGKRNKDEIKEVLSTADVFLLTSYFEGLPNVALEAMAMQLPVVSTKCGGVEEAITQPIEGCIANVYDVETLVQHVNYLLSSADVRNEMGKAARKKVEQAFTIQQQIDEFEKQYRLLF